MSEKILNVKQISEYMGVTRIAIYNAMKLKKLKSFINEDGDRVSHLKDVDNYIEFKFSREKSSYPNGELIYDKSKGLYSPRQIAAVMGVDVQKIYYWIRRRYIPYEKFGCMYILNIKDLCNLPLEKRIDVQIKHTKR